MLAQSSGSSFYILTILIASSAVILLGMLYLKDVRSTCSHCGKVFKKTSELNNHIRRAHRKNKDSKRCFICDKEFENGSALLFHCKTLHDVIDYNYKACLICNHHFRNSKELLAHHMAAHDVIDYRKIQVQETPDKVQVHDTPDKVA